MTQKVTRYFFLFFVVSIPLSQFASSRILIALVVLGLFVRNEKFEVKSFLLQGWDIFLYYSILIFGLIYTENFFFGLRQLETSFCLLGMPLAVYSFGTSSKKNLDQLFYAFLAGLFIACLICLLNAGLTYSDSSGSNVSLFLYQTLTAPLDAQPTYFAYYLIFGITVLLYKFYFDLHRKHLLLTLFLISFFFLMLLLTGGQTAFVSLLFIFSFFLSKFMVQRNSKRESAAVVLILVAIAMMAVWTSFNPLKSSASEFTNNDYWERMTLWESALRANENSWLGVGTGDYEKVLNEYYQKNNMGHFAKSNLNAHNQYIQLLFSNGIFGLIAFLIMLLRPLYFSVKHQDLFGVLIFFPFILYGITEVFLGRYQGVIFFALVHQSLVCYYAGLAKSDKVDNLQASIN